MAYSSEAIKAGLLPDKAEFRNKLDPDIMGFDGKEGMEMEENENDSK